MTVLTIMLAIAIPLGIAALNAWINIKIKFAKDAPQAIRDTKTVFSTLWEWATYAYSAGVLVWCFLLSSAPVDRYFIFIVLLNSFFLFEMHTAHWVGRILGVIDRLIDADDDIRARLKN